VAQENCRLENKSADSAKTRCQTVELQRAIAVTNRESSSNFNDDPEDDHACTGCIVEIDSLLQGRPISDVAHGDVWGVGTDDKHLTLLIRHASGDIGQIFTFDGRDIMITHKEKHVSFKYNASRQAFEEVFPTQLPSTSQSSDTQ
jgi:hypothetical protein